MNTDDSSIQLLELLTTCRRTLAHLLQQAAQYGGIVYAPPYVINGIHEAQANIRRIKATLRNSGLMVSDDSDDELLSLEAEATAVNPPSSRNYANIQGVVSNPSDLIQQTNFNTSGDYAEGNIDKRTGVFVSGGTIHGGVIGTQENYYIQTERQSFLLSNRNRLAMLEKVKAIWIRGLLTQSLAQEVRIALSLVEQSDAVSLALNTQIQELNHPPQALPPDIPIIDVFSQLGGALLILGEPGTGKTTLLLELARDLIIRAGQDPVHPIPVVFNLSSWTEHRSSLGTWMIEELSTKYDVPRQIGNEWVNQDILLPLLDGLDEVAVGHREDCAQAINDFRQEHGLSPIAVCSRTTDYNALTIRLRLQGAIVIQPLTEPQIDTYLNQFGEKLASLRMALQHNSILRELVDTPLMLHVMSLAYQEMSIDELIITKSFDEHRQHLFNSYVKQMFLRRRSNKSYDSQRFTHWLAKLAQIMLYESKTILLVENIQPEWLSSNKAHKQYLIIDRLMLSIIVALACGVFGGILAGLFAVLFGSTISNFSYETNLGFFVAVRYIFIFPLIFALVAGLFGGKDNFKSRGHALELMPNLGHQLKVIPSNKKFNLENPINTNNRFKLSIRAKYFSNTIGVLDKIAFWIIVKFFDKSKEQFDEQQHNFQLLINAVRGGVRMFYPSLLGVIVISGIILLIAPIIHINNQDDFLSLLEFITLNIWFLGFQAGFLAGALAGGFDRQPRKVIITETLRWSWSKAKISGRNGIIWTLVTGIPTLLISGIFNGLMYGLTAGVIWMLIGGLVGDELEAKTIPNQGIRRSAHNMLFSGLIFGLSIGFIRGLFYSIRDGQIRIIDAIAVGITCGVVGGLAYGGYACMSHIALRLVLWEEDIIPLNYTRFLDEAADRIFLRRIGGGYIFIHRLLMEYFASLEPEPDRDYFVRNTGPWSRGKNKDRHGKFQRSINHGKYRWEIISKKENVFRIEEFQSPILSNFELKVNYERLTGNCSCGLLFGNKRDRLIFQIDGNNFSVMYFNFNKKRFEFKAMPTPSKFIKINESNELKVIIENDNTKFFINDEFVGDIEHDRFKRDRVGLVVLAKDRTQIAVEFSDLHISYISQGNN